MTPRHLDAFKGWLLLREERGEKTGREEGEGRGVDPSVFFTNRTLVTSLRLQGFLSRLCRTIKNSNPDIVTNFMAPSSTRGGQ